MMRHVLGFMSVSLGVLMLISNAEGQSLPPRAIIEPTAVLLPVGQSQSFQLLQSDGNEVASSDWFSVIRTLPR